MIEELPHLERAARIEELVTPEGVPVRIGVASVAERLVAFLLDVGIIIGSVIVFVLLAVWIQRAIGSVVAMLVIFLLRNFYFIGFELRWRGSTPGKRATKLRVVEAHGGQLTVEAVIVRNLTREVETFMPLTVLVMPDLLWPGAPGWTQVIAGLWALFFVLIPFFNPQRRRLGDLAAGTMVIKAPQVALLEDLTATAPAQAPEGEEAWTFTPQQLEVYGTYELQVLEDLLRAKDLPDGIRGVSRVSETIQRKIGWERRVVDHEAFLQAFYTALRRHLEQRMLLGKARERKEEGGAPRGPESGSRESEPPATETGSETLAPRGPASGRPVTEPPEAKRPGVDWTDPD